MLLAAVPVLLTGYCFFGLIWSWAWASLLQLFVDFHTFESWPLLTCGVPVLGAYPIATAP